MKLLFPSTDVAQSALSCIKSSLAVVERRVLATFLRHSISMLFVGNLPYTFEREDLRSLFEPFGNVARCFVVCSVRTGLSKGYGFVELATVEQAREAKVKMANKLLGNRGLRVDFADSGIQTSSDLHSQTLFVDRLPMEVMESRVSCLKEMFGKFGTVSFCQVHNICIMHACQLCVVHTVWLLSSLEYHTIVFCMLCTCMLQCSV